MITRPLDMTRDAIAMGLSLRPQFLAATCPAGNRIRKCRWISGCDVPNRAPIPPGREIARSSIVSRSLAKRRGHVAPCQLA